MIVIVCEKPSVARDVAAVVAKGAKSADGFLDGGEIKLTWGLGHLLELVDPEAYEARWKQWDFSVLPMVPDNFRFAEQPVRNGAKQLKAVSQLLRQADEIVNACDAGREGELIFWRMARFAGWGKGKEPGEPGGTKATRLWLDSMTPETIRRAWAQRRPLTEPRYANLARAAYSRAEADWLLGLNMTRAASLAFPRQSGRVNVKVWSVGRVQTPVLAEIVRRDKAIENFRPEAFFQVEGKFGADGYSALIDVPEGMAKLGDKRDRFASRDAAEAIAGAITRHRECEWTVTDERTRKTERPPKLFSLTSLQRHCAGAFGWTAKHTLEVAQECYEKHKTLTYPRTESENLPDDYPETAQKVFAEVSSALGAKGEGLKNPRESDQQWHFNSKKVSDHFAIIPTGTIPADTASDAGKLWALVAGRFVVAFADTAIAWEVKRTLTGAPEKDALIGRVSGKTYESRGWLNVAEGLGLVRARHDSELPAVGETDRASGAEVRSGQTKPPDPYNESSLLSMMENVARIVEADHDHDEESLEDLKDALAARGLGTPATRADIIETLLRRGFLVRQKKSLVATEAGRLLIDNLVAKNLDALTKPALTADWEMRLKGIERGDDLRRDFLEDLVRLMTGMLGNLSPLPGRSGKDPVSTSVFCPISGEAIQDCGSWFVFPGLEGVKFWRTVAQREMSAEDYRAVVAGEDVVFEGFVSKAGNPFSAGLAFDRTSGKVSFVFADRGGSGGGLPRKELSLICPKAERPVEETPKAWTFPGWPELTCWKTMAGRKMRAEDYRDALVAGMDGRPGPTLKGFKSKAGKPFSAALKLSGNRFEFDFQ